MIKTCYKKNAHLIASMVHVPSSELKDEMMDVEKQSNGSGEVLAIFGIICSCLSPCSDRFYHSKIRPHLASCPENCQVSRFPGLGDSEIVPRKSKIVKLHCYRMPEEEGDEMAWH